MSEETVRVIVRCRPLNKREKDLGCKVVVETLSDTGQVALTKPGSSDVPKRFTFDGAYGMNSNSKMIYEDMGFPLIESVLEGYNGTVFAYGQTGCGKSFTMEGIPNPPEHRGITPRSFEHIFQEVAVREHTKFLVRVSYLEIYNETIRDLLGSNHDERLELKEHPDKGVYVKGLTEHVVHNAQEVLKVMALGSKSRSVGATLMNADSSRSHSIFTVLVEACETATDGDEKIRASKLNLVDLAGSERQGKTGAQGVRLKEATKINLSLSALGNVISALVDGKAKHIPYRDSKLTRLLQDSLGGNTKTLMVAALSPADNNYDETLSTLRYANRAKNIKNKAIINEDPKDALLRQYQEEIQQLKQLLMSQGNVDPSLLAQLGANALAPPTTTTKKEAQQAPKAKGATAQPLSKEEVAEIEERVRKEKEAELQQMEERLKQDYDKKLEELQTAVEEQRMTNEKLEQEFEKLTGEYNVNRATARENAEKEIGKQVASEIKAEEEDRELMVSSEGVEGGVPIAAREPQSPLSSGPAENGDVSLTSVEDSAPQQPLQTGALVPQKEEREFEVIPQCYVVIEGKTGEMHYSVRQAGSRSYYKAAEGSDGCLHPLVTESTANDARQGEGTSPSPSAPSVKPIRIKGARVGVYQMVKKVRQYPIAAVAAVLPDGNVQAALLGINNTPVSVSCGRLGELEVALNEHDEEDEITGSDGLPVPYLSLDKNTIVVRDREGRPRVAYVTQDGLPVECIATEAGLKPRMRSSDAADNGSTEGGDGNGEGAKSIKSASARFFPVIGSDGLAATPVVCRHSCLTLPMRVAVLRVNGILHPGIISADGIPLIAKYDPQSKFFVPETADGGAFVELCSEDGGKDCVQLAVADSTVMTEKAVAALQQQRANASARRASLAPSGKDGATGGNQELADLDAKAPTTTAPTSATLADADEKTGVVPSPETLLALQAKVKALEAQMVSGGAKAADKELKEKLKKRRKRAQEKRKKVLDKLKSADDDGVLEEIYDNMQDELKGKRRALEKAKDIIRTQKQEIADLQTEFERERELLLEQIRQSEKEKAFYTQYVDRVLPVVRTDCNYHNLTKIRNASVWNEDAARWMMPSLTREVLHLPSGRERSSRANSAMSHGSDDDPTERIRDRLGRSHGSDALNASQQTAVLSRMSMRGAQIEQQQDRRIQSFAHQPLASSRAQQLLNRERSSPRSRRSRLEPGAVSIADMTRAKQQSSHVANASAMRRNRRTKDPRPVDDW